MDALSQFVSSDDEEDGDDIAGVYVTSVCPSTVFAPAIPTSVLASV